MYLSNRRRAWRMSLVFVPHTHTHELPCAVTIPFCVARGDAITLPRHVAATVRLTFFGRLSLLQNVRIARPNCNLRLRNTYLIIAGLAAVGANGHDVDT